MVSLKRLRILSSPTCVGLRYGSDSVKLRSFSWQHGINSFTGLRPSYSGLIYRVTDLPITPDFALKPPQPIGGLSILLRHSIAHYPKIGILTDYSSTTLLSLALDPA